MWNYESLLLLALAKPKVPPTSHQAPSVAKQTRKANFRPAESFLQMDKQRQIDQCIQWSIDFDGRTIFRQSSCISITGEYKIARVVVTQSIVSASKIHVRTIGRRLALLKLDEPIKFSEIIQPIRLTLQTIIEPGTSVIVIDLEAIAKKTHLNRHSRNMLNVKMLSVHCTIGENPKSPCDKSSLILKLSYHH